MILDFRSEILDCNMTTQEIEIKFGKQSVSDNEFTRKARLLQSIYREDVLKERCGTGPFKNSKTQYGNMLAKGEETGSNFLSPFRLEILEYAYKKIEEKKKNKHLTIDEFRLFNNMLSSMPLCFNLFVPLKTALSENEPFVREGFKKLFFDLPIHKIVCIDVEFIRNPKYYTNDKSAFDAIVSFESENNRMWIIGIEVKYTDKLGKNTSKGNSEKKQKKNIKKIEVVKESKIFTQEAIESFEDSNHKFPQIERNVLLTEAYRLNHGITFSQSIILSPQEDTESKEEIEKFQKLLTDKSKLKRVTLENFVSTFQKFATNKYRSWLNEFNMRYLDFKLIEKYL
ncbi:MAG: hypothetical protein FJ218_11260 [Ignavibacteria bacterium]|nr:hypothetical protein [Ignavibacteria bacterium]